VNLLAQETFDIAIAIAIVSIRIIHIKLPGEVDFLWPQLEQEHTINTLDSARDLLTRPLAIRFEFRLGDLGAGCSLRIRSAS
jgi:hypothetical protein